MRAKAFPLLEQTIEDWLRGYLLNRVNKYVERVRWVQQKEIDGPVRMVTAESGEAHVREIATEAADHIMTGICEAFTFTDDEAVVPMEEEPEVLPSPRVVYLPDDQVEKIIALIEEDKRQMDKGREICIDSEDWEGAIRHESIGLRLDWILRRIKAEDFEGLTSIP